MTSAPSFLDIARPIAERFAYKVHLIPVPAVTADGKPADGKAVPWTGWPAFAEMATRTPATHGLDGLAWLQAKATDDPGYSRWNCGIVASRDVLCVLDVDQADLIARIESETGVPCPTTFTGRSAGRGLPHVYFAPTPRTRGYALTKMSRAGFDFYIEHAQCVAPGSVRADGRAYTIAVDAPLAPLPDAWFDWLVRQPARGRVGRNGEPSAALDAIRAAYAQRHSLDDILALPPEAVPMTDGHGTMVCVAGLIHNGERDGDTIAEFLSALRMKFYIGSSAHDQRDIERIAGDIVSLDPNTSLALDDRREIDAINAVRQTEGGIPIPFSALDEARVWAAGRGIPSGADAAEAYAADWMAAAPPASVVAPPPAVAQVQLGPLVATDSGYTATAHVQIGEQSETAELTASRLRWDKQDLRGEIDILAGANVQHSTCVLTSAASRRDLATAFQPVEVYRAVLGRFCRDVVRAERTASEDAAVWLHTVPRPTADPLLTPGFLPPLPRKHLSIWFGDGDSGKSLMAMYAAGLLAQGGMKVAYFDWELDASDHKERLARVFGEQEPTSLLYVKCDRPLVQMADSLASLIKKHGIEYAVFDSIGYACAEPEAADSANQYVLAVRKLGIGSLHIAHITKGGANAALKPFGSVFWHNGARSTWYVRREEEGSTFGIPFIKSTFVQRKSNFGSRNTDGIHVQVDFAAQYHIRGIEAPLITRVINALERGPLTREELDPLVRPQNKKSFQRALQRAVAKKELLEDESTGKLRLPEAANDEEDSDAA